jgi:hypothetical protein
MSRLRPMPTMTAAQVQRFISRITFSGANDCWLYSTSNPSGYGLVDLFGQSYGAHRVSMFVFKGKDPLGKVVCHKCDNPPCVNPNHLYAGTAKTNMRDYMLNKRNIVMDALSAEAK